MTRVHPSTSPPALEDGSRALERSSPEAAHARTEALAEDQHVPLRLSVARGQLGLELYEAIELGPLEITALSLILPNLRFPVDLSGGVARFRHRRGDLEHVTLALSFDGLARFLRGRVGEVVPGTRRTLVWGLAAGIGVGVAGADRALAFELLWAPSGGDARLVVARARGVGLGAPALGHALRLLDSVLPSGFVRRGRFIVLEKAGRELGRVLLPAVGARAPGADRVRFGEVTVESDRLTVELDATIIAPALPPATTRELELGLLAVEGDEQLARSEIDDARNEYVTLLERAPRHPELVRLIAEIDAAVGGRGEAALGLLVETMPAHRAGLVGAELLARVGDHAGAREALREAVLGEPFAPLAALAFARLAALEPEVPERRAALDQAVARAPGLAEPRWARLALRLQHGDAEGALADAEHLEALHRGPAARHDACIRAARAFLEHGFLTDAGRLFERALRYAPDDSQATAGLARSLLALGKKARAVTLLERAIELAERKGRPDADALVDLGRLLADEVGDLPQAIARVREVASSSPRWVEARRLEALWRSRLGDLTGASLAYARMREGIELGRRSDREAVDWLMEAGLFEHTEQREPRAAELHLGLALRLAPHDPIVAERYREAAKTLADRLRLEREARRGG